MLRNPWHTSLSRSRAHHRPSHRFLKLLLDAIWPPPTTASSPGFIPRCTPHTPYQPTVNNPPPHIPPPMVVPLDGPFPATLRKIPSPHGPNTSVTMSNHQQCATFWTWGSCATHSRWTIQGRPNCTSEGGLFAGDIFLSQAWKGHCLCHCPRPQLPSTPPTLERKTGTTRCSSAL